MDFSTQTFETMNRAVNWENYKNPTTGLISTEKRNEINTIIYNVEESIKKLYKVEGDVTVDITNLFILSLINMISAQFTFNLRNYTGNWEIDMNNFFYVKFKYSNILFKIKIRERLLE